jgi:hypothetical protein
LPSGEAVDEYLACKLCRHRIERRLVGLKRGRQKYHLRCAHRVSQGKSLELRVACDGAGDALRALGALREDDVMPIPLEMVCERGAHFAATNDCDLHRISPEVALNS